MVTELQSFLEKLSRANRDLLKANIPYPRETPGSLIHQLGCWGSLLNIYKSKSSVSGNSLLSRFHPESGFKVCSSDEFHSDAVDNSCVGRDYDFNTPFFEQWSRLMRDTQLISNGISNIENCDYINGGINCKDCYLCFSVTEAQDCLYCYGHYAGNDNIDCCFVRQCQFCYSCTDCNGSYGCQNCTDCDNCSNCFFCLDCRGCNECIGCVGLNNQKYVAFNEQLTKVEYQRFRKEANLSSRSDRQSMRERFESFKRENRFQVNRIINSENSTGGYIKNSFNLHECFNSNECRDCGYLVTAEHSKDCWFAFVVKSELVYFGAGYNSYNCIFCYHNFDIQNCIYSFQLFNNCSDCFGCIALRRKSYCILNKQYTKEEYYELVPRIVAHMKSTGEWGQYFPAHLSPHAYRDCWVPEHLGAVSKANIAEMKLNTGKSYDLVRGEANISEVPDNVLEINAADFQGKSVQCRQTGALFNYQPKEIEFYQNHGIPLPELHWKTRLMSLLDAREKMPLGLD